MKNKIYKFFKPIVLRTEEFLKEDMNIDILSVNEYSDSLEIKELQKNIVMIGVSGSANFMMTLGYDNSLIEKLTEVFLEGEEVLDNEKDEIFESIASEIANTVVGNSLPENEHKLFITPPVFVKDAKALSKNKNSQSFIAIITTKYGILSIMAIYLE